MCLAIPAQVKELEEHNMAEVDIMGVSRHVSLDLVPEAKTDDWVLVHAGFAIQIVDEQRAGRRGPHALASELVGTQLADWFGLPTFDYSIIRVETDEIELRFANGQLAQTGPAFITRAV